MKVLFPKDVGEACGMLAGESSLTPIAGGTDLLVHWPVNLAARDKTYLDVSKLGELKPIRWTDGALVLGAMTTYWDVIGDGRAGREFPLLRAAARQVGAVQIQSRGTWAGNIVNASPAADGVLALMAYDAVVVMRSAEGEARVGLDEFYQGYKKMVRRGDQLITAIELPRRKHAINVLEKVGARRAQAITKVGLAMVSSDAGWRVVANSVAPTVKRCRGVETLLTDGRKPSEAEISRALDGDVAPIDDIRSTAVYRKAVLAKLIYHSVRGAG